MQPVPSLSGYDNSWYDHGRGPLVRLLWIVMDALVMRNPLFLPSWPKRSLLRLFGARLGDGVAIKPCISIKHPWMLEVGDYAWIGEHAWIDNLCLVRIGANCCVSQGAMLLTGNHNYKSPGFDLITGEIELEEGSWVGARAIVCPGVTLRRGSILAVGSVAARDLEEFGIYQGNPAVKVRMRRIDGATDHEPSPFTEDSAIGRQMN